MLSEEQLKNKKSVSKLTVGARALTKHAHRSSEGFWGEMKGSEVKKNEEANLKLEEIINTAIWVNVHLIVH